MSHFIEGLWNGLRVLVALPHTTFNYGFLTQASYLCIHLYWWCAPLGLHIRGAGRKTSHFLTAFSFLVWSCIQARYAFGFPDVSLHAPNKLSSKTSLLMRVSCLSPCKHIIFEKKHPFRCPLRYLDHLFLTFWWTMPLSLACTFPWWRGCYWIWKKGSAVLH